MRFYEQLSEKEQLYKCLYKRYQEAWEEPVNCLSEMVRRFHRAGITDIPERTLSFMETAMSEEEYFSENEKEVVCFHNLRYYPPVFHKLEFIKIIYVVRGSVTFYLNDAKYEMPSGNFCIITQGIKHAVFLKREEDVVINLLMRASSFSNVFSGILMEQNILTDFFWKILYTKHGNRMLMFRCKNDPKLDRWIEKLYDESARQKSASNLLLRSYVMIFLGIVMRDHLKELQRIEELTDEVYVLPAIIQTIKKNMKTITLQELTARFGMEESELRRYIVRESGYTYGYLLRDLRMRKAVQLLHNTKFSIERIMEEVGYSNMTNFYRSFKDRFGKTPQEYRKMGEEILI